MRTLLLLSLPFAACAPVTPEPPPPPARTTFAFEAIAVDGVAPRWGAASVGPFVVGGTDTSMRVTQDLFAIDASDGTLHASAVGTLDVPRYCNCAMFDESRHELVVLGGRNAQFIDNKNAEIINTETGEHTALDHAGSADHPVGCQAFFSKTADKGWVFGGLDSSSGFGGKTYRYDPTSHTMTALDIVGPHARYDAGIHQLDNGDILLVGGMGQALSGAVFFSDVWRFDAAAETWSEVATTSTDLPKGRRYPWTSLAPDESTLLYGYGSDAGDGSHVLGDMWTFAFDTGAWTELTVDGAPDARGFTYNWRGPAGTAGVLAFGTDAALSVFADAYVMRVPDALTGTWH